MLRVILITKGICDRRVASPQAGFHSPVHPLRPTMMKLKNRVNGSCRGNNSADPGSTVKSCSDGPGGAGSISTTTKTTSKLRPTSLNVHNGNLDLKFKFLRYNNYFRYP